MPAVVLWDIMDTLVRDPFYTHMPQFFGVQFEQLVRQLRPHVWVEFELGRLAAPEFYARFFADGRPVDGAGLERCMREAYTWVDGMEALLADLKARAVPMHALSNYPSWYRMIDARLGLSRYLALSFMSCETGVRKPQPEAFERACAALAVGPEACLLIDDRQANCDAARAAGLAAWHFSGDVAELRRRFIAAGLL